MLDFREAQSVAYIEFQDGAVYVQDPDRVKKHDFRRKRMCSRATPAAQAIKDRLDRLAAWPDVEGPSRGRATRRHEAEPDHPDHHGGCSIRQAQGTMRTQAKWPGEVVVRGSRSSTIH
jgi:hypothetical protein